MQDCALKIQEMKIVGLSRHRGGVECHSALSIIHLDPPSSHHIITCPSTHWRDMILLHQMFIPLINVPGS